MDFIVILFGFLFLYYLGLLLYHLVSKVVYIEEAYMRSFSRNILFGSGVAFVGFGITFLAFYTDYGSPIIGNKVLLAFPLGVAILALTAIDAMVRKQNWERYTLSKFVGGAVYDFEAQYQTDGLIFGRIYWDRNKDEQCFCHAYLNAREKDVFVKGKIYKVKFVGDYCLPKQSDLGCNLVEEV